jgi:hypothetical protein
MMVKVPPYTAPLSGATVSAGVAAVVAGVVAGGRDVVLVVDREVVGVVVGAGVEVVSALLQPLMSNPTIKINAMIMKRIFFILVFTS